MATVVDNPLVLEKLARLRDQRTPTPEFKRLLHEIAVLMLPSVFADARLRSSVRRARILDERLETGPEAFPRKLGKNAAAQAALGQYRG